MSPYIIIKATACDLDRIMRLLDCGRDIMRSDGNVNQWPVGKPSRETIENDIAQANSYLVMDGDETVATFAFIPGPDPTYAVIEGGLWERDDVPYHVVHRLASTPQSHGVFAAVIGYCKAHSTSLRIDTHRDNHIMQHNLLKHAFTHRGTIYLQDGSPRLAYQWLPEEKNGLDLAIDDVKEGRLHTAKDVDDMFKQIPQIENIKISENDGYVGRKR